MPRHKITLDGLVCYQYQLTNLLIKKKKVFTKCTKLFGKFILTSNEWSSEKYQTFCHLNYLIFAESYNSVCYIAKY